MADEQTNAAGQPQPSGPETNDAADAELKRREDADKASAESTADTTTTSESSTTSSKRTSTTDK